MRIFIPALFHTQNWLSLESEKSYPMTGDKVMEFLRSQKLELHQNEEEHSNKNDVYVKLNSTQFQELKKAVDGMENYWLEQNDKYLTLDYEFTLKCF